MIRLKQILLEQNDANLSSFGEMAPIMQVISDGESVKGSYGSVSGGKINVNLVNMSIELVLNEYTTAVGRWQFMPATLQSALTHGQVTKSDKFDKTTQDKLALWLLNQRNINQTNLKKDTLKYSLELCKIWAALPVLQTVQGATRLVNQGESYYSGVGTNKATITAEKFKKAIETVIGTTINISSNTNCEISVLVIGDSQSDGDNKWPVLLKKSRPALKVQTIAQGGHTAKQQLIKLNSTSDIENVDFVCILIGGNGGWVKQETSDTKDTMDNKINNQVDIQIQDITNLIKLAKQKAPKSKIILITNPTKRWITSNMIPDLVKNKSIYDQEWVPDNNPDKALRGGGDYLNTPMIVLANEGISSQSKSLSGVDYVINLFSKTYNDKSWFTNDMIHINNTAHTWISDEVNKLLPDCIKKNIDTSTRPASGYASAEPGSANWAIETTIKLKPLL
jgi:lysophospholipase L1-like esterase